MLNYQRVNSIESSLNHHDLGPKDCLQNEGCTAPSSCGAPGANGDVAYVVGRGARECVLRTGDLKHDITWAL